jgi:hypothetical protein
VRAVFEFVELATRVERSTRRRQASFRVSLAAIESAEARLDCFDALARRARAADPAAEQAVPAAERADLPSRRHARAAGRGEREQVSQAASLRELQSGRLEVTLTTGQIWRQTNSDRYNLLVGHEVRIYPTGFGQYWRAASFKSNACADACEPPGSTGCASGDTLLELVACAPVNGLPRSDNPPAARRLLADVLENVEA